MQKIENLERALQSKNHRTALDIGYDYVMEAGCDIDDRKVQIQYKGSQFVFNIETKAPGKIEIGGNCEVSDSSCRTYKYWAVDSNNQCWVVSFVSKYLHPVTVEQMLLRMEKIDDRLSVLRRFQMPLDRPTWYLEAIKAGWVPPQGVYATERASR